MLRLRPALLSLGLVLLMVGPSQAQAPQFRADVTQDGDNPFDGTLYFGSGRMRIEGVSDGEEMTAIIDGSTNMIIVLMPDDQAYMTMDLGSAPFSAPGAQPMDPANPCSGGEVTECRSLGTETVNGYAARGWEYTRDGERETAWIATELRFPVRTVEADGTTTDFTNVQVGAQPAALFQPPTGWTQMDMSAMLGGFGGGRGVPPGGLGRGQVPPAATGRGAVPPGAAGRGATGRGAPAGVPAGIDPTAAAQLTAQLQAMGLPPDQIAAAIAQLGAVAATQGIDYSAWESGDGWVVDVVITASGSESNAQDGRTGASTYSARYQGSVPITYGTPGAGGRGPAWQLVATLGSARALAQPMTFTGTAEYRGEFTSPDLCPIDAATRTVIVSTATAQLSTSDHSSPAFLAGGSRFQISGDLGTYDLMAGVGATGTETTTTTVTSSGPCAGPPSTETSTRELTLSGGFQLTDLPLAASPGAMRGTNTVPMRFQIGRFEGELDATVVWTLRPIQ
ncbi:MAG: DUF4412 domain-containing protein [Longimicrobiales bacterium]